ncbi:MAG: DUF4180 domain-containing protein [Bacteroidales bacterium]|jgi:hypothetical protein|nr:DUF4180 domain-containing protein [Bacteroidales bacterium]
MFIIHPDDATGSIAELRPGTVTIGSAEDAVDILGNASYENYTKVIIHSDSFASGFFDLRTGMAGDILQKFSNYRMRLAIVGDFSHLKSRSWRDFIRESNRGKTVCFMPTMEEAISALRK